MSPERRRRSGAPRRGTGACAEGYFEIEDLRFGMVGGDARSLGGAAQAAGRARLGVRRVHSQATAAMTAATVSVPAR